MFKLVLGWVVIFEIKITQDGDIYHEVELATLELR